MLGSSRGQTPLPTSQIAILMCTRLAEPISYTVIFPFVNQFIEELGITDNPDRVGFYSGLVESVFAFVQFFTVYHWAKLSDRIGRKPVILIGLVGVAISGSLFGLSTSFWMMIIVRCLSGALNGNVAVVRAALGDITDETNSTEAFAMYGLTWTVGSIIGNAFGGTLSHPYERLPKLFGNVELFRIHPYLLPCLVCAGCTVVGILFCACFFRESLPAPQSSVLSMKYFSHRRTSSSASTLSDADTLVDPESPTTERLLSKFPPGAEIAALAPRSEWTFKRLMAYRPVQIMSVTMFLNSFVGGAWAAASLLFFFDKNNGLGMSASAIGTALAVNGVWTIACQLLLLNRIRRYFGIALAFKILSFAWIPLWFMLPMLRSVLEATESPVSAQSVYDPVRFGEERGWATSIGVNLVLSFVSVIGMANSLLMVLVNFSCPDQTAYGAVNGISTAVGCMARVVGPSLVSALYAISMDGKVMGGRLWWIFMVLMSTINFVSAMFVSQDPPAKRLGVIDEEEEPRESAEW